MPPLALLVAALVCNYARHKKGSSTICSTCRKRVGPISFTLGWAVLTAWLWPHYAERRKFHTKPWLP